MMHVPFSQANQDMLWKTFEKIPQLTKININNRFTIFKNTLQECYQIYGNKQCSKTDLQKINRSILMKLFDIVKNEVNNTKVENVLESSPLSLSNQIESEEEKTTRLFNEKSVIYNNMTEKPKVPKPSELFQEQQEDGAITNMDELIKNYQAQRSLDVPVYNPSSSDGKEKYDSSLNQIEDISLKEKIKYLEQKIELVSQMEERLNNLEKRFEKKYNDNI